jgi:hypothetical protein
MVLSIRLGYLYINKLLSEMKTDILKLNNLLKKAKNINLPAKITELSKAKAKDSYNKYSKYQQGLNNLISKEEDIKRYDDRTYMRILRLIIGEFNERTMEAYYEFISRRFKYNGLPMSTEKFYEYVNSNMPR